MNTATPADDGATTFGFSLTAEQWQDEADNLTFLTTKGEASLEELVRLKTLFEYRIHALGSGHHETKAPVSATGLPPRLNELIGEVVVCCARVEQEAGELLQVLSGNLDAAVTGYGSTGTKLLKNLKSKIPDDLHSKFESVLEFRHYIVHGVYGQARYFVGNGSGLAEGFVAMKQTYGKKVAGFDLRYINEKTLVQLRGDLQDVSQELSILIGQAMLDHVRPDEGSTAQL